MKKAAGSVGNIMMTMLCILAMTIVMLSYMNSVQLIQQKTEVSQLARKYILRMETVGYLTSRDRAALTQELYAVGVTNVDYSGSTMNSVSYGVPITLQIRGRLRGEYEITEKRVSTSKN